MTTGKALRRSAGTQSSEGYVWSVLALTVASMLAVAPPAVSQTVHGRLLEQGTGRPIEAGDVTLLGEVGAAVDRAETDSAGRFILRSPDPGSFYVRAERIGYRAKMDGVLELGEGGDITIDFYLMPEPVELEGVEAAVEGMTLLERKDREYLESRGFYDRKKVGLGHFITPEEIEERQPFGLFDLFLRVPFVRGGSGSVRMISRDARDESGYCTPTVIVDRNVVPGGPIPSVDAIVGVEIYRGAARVPLQYSFKASPCGVILIWTKG